MCFLARRSNTAAKSRQGEPKTIEDRRRPPTQVLETALHSLLSSRWYGQFQKKESATLRTHLHATNHEPHERSDDQGRAQQRAHAGPAMEFGQHKEIAAERGTNAV